MSTDDIESVTEDTEKLAVVTADEDDDDQEEADSVNEDEQTKDETGISQGESLLLPLLKGLLHRNTPQRALNQCENNKGENSVLPVEDSGTESGEDLKLLAAGLQDSIDTHRIKQDDSLNKDNEASVDILEEVTGALERLQNSLLDGKELKVDPNKRNTLLKLVSRLQSNLLSENSLETNENGSTNNSSDDIVNNESSRKTSANRFAKRRNRHNRHTVGVSREELADARRLMEDIIFRESLSSSCTTEPTTPVEFPNILQKQNSTGTILPIEQNAEPVVLYRPNQFVQKQQQQSGKNEPSQISDHKPKYKFMRQAISYEQPDYVNDTDDTKITKRPLSFTQNNPTLNSDDLSSDEDTTTKKFNKTYKYKPSSNQNLRNKFEPNNKSINNETTVDNSNGNQLEIYYNTPEANIQDSDNSKNVNRFNSKKIKMKRAYTINIPKYDNEFERPQDRFESFNTGSALKGTIQVSAKVPLEKKVPSFEPKTENDHKFMAFLQKQSPNNVGLPFLNSNNMQTRSNAHNWNNAFGSIKNIFESSQSNTVNKVNEVSGLNNAKSFWKKSEYTKVDINGNSKKTFKYPWSSKPTNLPTNLPATSQRIQEPLPPRPPIEKFKAPPTPVIKPYSVSVNQFSHAPLSAFKPPLKTPEYEPVLFKPIPTQESCPLTPSTNQERSAESSPNPINYTKFDYEKTLNMAKPEIKPFTLSPTKRIMEPFSPPSKSPIGVPWATKVQDKRVLNLAASKFEKKPETNLIVRSSPLGKPQSNQDMQYINDGSRNNLQTFKNTPIINNAINSTYIKSPSQLKTPQKQEFPAYTYTCTDYTQPTNISTYIPNEHPNKFDSLTNPSSEPLVLTAQRPIISPIKKNINSYDSNSISPNTDTSSIRADDDFIDSKEYTVVSKIMQGPVGQTATVTNRISNQSNNTNERDTMAMKNLHSSLKKVTNRNPTQYQPTSVRRDSLPKMEINNNFTGHVPLPVVSNTQQNSTITDANLRKDIHRLNNQGFGGYNSLAQIIRDDTESKQVSNKTYSRHNVPTLMPRIDNQPNISPNSNFSNYRAVTAINRRDTEPNINERNNKFNDFRKPIPIPRFQQKEDTTNMNNYLNNPAQASAPAPMPRKEITPKFDQNNNRFTDNRKPVPMPRRETQPLSEIRKPSIIINTPTTPMKEENIKFPSHVIYNNTNQHPVQQQTKPQSQQQQQHYQQPQQYQQQAYQYEKEYLQQQQKLSYQSNKVKLPPQLFNNQKEIQRMAPQFTPQNTSPNPLAKSDSWHQICRASNETNVTKTNLSESKGLQRTKSGHSLTVPKQFEAGITKSEVTEKQKTVAAYFSGKKSPQSMSMSYKETSKSSAINRIKSKNKASTNNQNPSSGLMRSQTMPHLAGDIKLLDEENVEDAFEDLFNSVY